MKIVKILRYIRGELETKVVCTTGTKLSTKNSKTALSRTIEWKVHAKDIQNTR
jgi:hypothetical protein